MMAFTKNYLDVATMKELKNKLSLLLFVVVVISCKPDVQSWQLENSIELDGVSPLGISFLEDDMWISDSDNNRIVQLDKNGRIKDEIPNIQRPMHICAVPNGLLIPEFGSDQMLRWGYGRLDTLRFKFSQDLDAPASVASYQSEKAIADFYNHRILFYNGSEWMSIGKEGKGNGEFYYPTDIQITENEILVADAYNNRVQVLDKEGNFIRMYGQDLGMNAATGIYQSSEELFITDFENDRVLVLDSIGNLKQEILELSNPVDATIHKDTLYVLNYKSKIINRYSFK